MLKVQDPDTVILCDLDDANLGGGQPLRRRFGDRVKQIVDGPVEHFDQKREFLQDSAVDMVRPARGIRNFNGDAAYCWDFGGIVLRRAAVIIYRCSAAKNAETSTAVNDQRANHDAHNDL